MEKKIKIFGMSIEFGDSIPNFEKIDKLIVKTGKHIIETKKYFAEFSQTVNSMDGSAQILQFMKEYEVRTKNTSVSRRKLTTEEKVANKIARENTRVEELQALALQRRQGSIKQMEAEIAKLRIVYENLTRAERQTAQGQAMKAHLTSLRKEMRELRMETGDCTNNIGNYVSGLYNKTTMLVTGIGLYLGTFKRFLSGLYAPFQDLEYRMAMVRAISSASDEEFDMLETTARRLGATTEYTATEVAGLELAYSRMGFAPAQIRDLAGATLDLATATGENLEKTADTVATTLRGFQLGADQTQRVADVMAKSFNSSSLRLDYFTESMKYVAPIAKAANIPLEETVAMLGVLADRGIRGGAAGTALRRIFSEIAKEGGDVNQRLAELSQRGLTLGGAMDEVGKYAMTALKVLTDAKGDVDGLAVALNNAGGSAKKAADIIRDTSKGDWDVLLSAVTEKLISIGEVLSPIVRRSMQFMTWAVTNLKSIVITIGIYAAAVKAATALKSAWLVVTGKVTVAETAFGRALQVNLLHLRNASASTKLFAAAKLLLTGNIKAATTAFKMFTGALASNPFGLIAVGIATLISYFVVFREKTDASAIALKRFNDENDRFNSSQENKRQQIERLIQTIQDENETDYAKIRAYEELQRLSPALTEKYSKEQIATLKLADSTKILNEQRDKENYDHLVSEVNRLTASLKKLREENGEVIGYAPNGGGAITLDNSKQIEQQEAELKEYKELLNEVVDARNKAAEEMRPIEVRIAEVETDISQLEQALEQAKTTFRQKRDEWVQEHGSDLFMPFEFRYDVYSLEKQLTETRKKASELQTKKNTPAPLSSENDDKSEKKWSLANDTAHNAELLKLKRQLYAGEIASEQEYQNKVLALEIETLSKRIRLNKEAGADRLKLQQLLEDKQYKYRQTQQKEEEKYNENRRKSEEQTAAYVLAHRESEINAMRDGIEKKMKLNALSIEKNKQSAAKEYKTTIEQLNKEQATYANDKRKFDAVEQEKARIKDAYEAKLTDIVSAGSAERLNILKSATNEELLLLAKREEYAAEVQQAINAKITEQTAMTNQAMLQAESGYIAEMHLADELYDKEQDRKAARLQAEVDLRQAKFKAYESELQMLAQLGQFDSGRYAEVLAELKRLQTELKNLGKGKNADGTGGSWLTRVLGLDKEDVKQICSAALDVARQVNDAIAQVQTEASQRRLSQEKDRIQEEYDAEVSNLEKKRKRGVISERKYQKEMDKLENEKKQKEEKAEKEAFKRGKRISLTQAAINTALAITNALATVKPMVPAGIIAAATAAATGAVQIATISAQKYRRGGVIDPIDSKAGILRGPSHEHGGMPIYIGGQYVGEAEGDELFAIVNKRDTQTLGALSQLNAKHGKKFARGGLFARTGVSAPVDYAGTATNFVTQGQMVEGYKSFAKLVQSQTEAINRRIDRIKVYVLQSEIAAANKSAENLKAQTTF